jgi:hypothetical protein
MTEKPDHLFVALDLMTTELEQRGFSRQDIAVTMTDFGIALGCKHYLIFVSGPARSMSTRSRCLPRLRIRSGKDR